MSSVDSVPPTTPAFQLRPTPSSGLSLFATTPLSAGSLILTDVPLFVISEHSKDPEELYRLVRALGTSARRAYLELADAKCMEQDVTPLMGIFKTNVLPAGPEESGIFPLASRLNHSCTPNAEPTFSTRLNTLSVRALQPVDQDAELTISYLGPRLLLPAQERQAWLLRSFGFLCECEACTVEFDVADQLRAAIATLKVQVDRTFTTDPSAAFEASLGLLKATRKAKLVVEHAFALATLSQLLILWGAGGSALCEAYVKQTTEAMRVCRGENDDWARWVKWEGKTAEHPRNGVVGMFDFTKEEEEAES